MKKLFSSLLLLTALCTAAYAQSSTNESDALRIDWLGNSQLSVKNKQNCTATILVDFGTSTTNITLAAGATQTITAPPNAQIGQLRAKPQTNCGSYSMGYVSLPLSVLPIKFKSVTSKWLDKRTLLVIFDVAEVSGVNYYKVRVSRDGMTWEDKTVVFPETTEADHIYQVKLTF